MYRRTWGVLLMALLVLVLSSLGCSVGQLVARGPQATLTPTRTPRPTWTPMPGGVTVATPTLDRTRFPNLVVPTQRAATPQPFVLGPNATIFVPQPPGGGPAVQTVVVIIVTATPIPPPTPTPTNYVLPTRPPPTPTPGPPTATPTVTGTPVPPVVVVVKEDQTNVRQGPGPTYPVVTQLDANTRITVVGRNREGTWWKVCCVNGADVWIADQVVSVEGPVWVVPEVASIPPAPPAPVVTLSPTPAPTATYAWTFRGRACRCNMSWGRTISV